MNHRVPLTQLSYAERIAFPRTCPGLIGNSSRVWSGYKLAAMESVLSVGNWKCRRSRVSRVRGGSRCVAALRVCSELALLSGLPLLVHTDKPRRWSLGGMRQERALEGLVAAVGSGRSKQVPSSLSTRVLGPRLFASSRARGGNHRLRPVCQSLVSVLFRSVHSAVPFTIERFERLVPLARDDSSSRRWVTLARDWSRP